MRGPNVTGPHGQLLVDGADSVQAADVVGTGESVCKQAASRMGTCIIVAKVTMASAG